MTQDSFSYDFLIDLFYIKSKFTSIDTCTQDKIDRLTHWTFYRMFISGTKISILNTNEKNKEKTIIKDNSLDVKMKNNDSSDATTLEKFNNIKIIKLRILNEQRTKLENWLF